MNYVLSERSARKVAGLLRGRMTSGSVPGESLRHVDPDRYPAPFTVQYSATEAAWMVWLPDVSQLVMDGEDYLSISGVTAAASYGDGWYLTDADVDEEELLLKLLIVKSGDYLYALLTSEDYTPSTGEEIVREISVAAMFYDADKGERFTYQFIDSAVVVGDGSDSRACAVDDVSIEEYNAADPGDPEELEHAVKGWHSQGASANKLSTMLTAAAEVTGKQLVVRNGAGGAIEYVPIGLLSIPDPIHYPIGGLSFVGGVRYDIDTFQLQQRIDTWNPATGVVTIGVWQMIDNGQAIPHSEVS